MSGPDALSAFFAELDDNPADQVTLLALADWFEEQDRLDAAACLRWAARHRYRPFHYRRDGGMSVTGSDWRDGWFWWAKDDQAVGWEWGHEPTCRLPGVVWRKLKHSFQHEPLVFKDYPSRQAAYEALIAAWPLVVPAEAELSAWERLS
jgi:hypothetical protein